MLVLTMTVLTSINDNIIDSENHVLETVTNNRSDMNNVGDEHTIYAETYLNETSDVRVYSVNEILKWYHDNPSVNGNPSLDVILYFLRGCKFNLDKTKEKMKKFYLMRAERVEWYSNRDPYLPEIQELLELGVFLPLKQRDKDNRLIVIIRTAAHNPKMHAQNNVFKVGNMILDYVLHIDPTISIYGVAAIFDMKGITLQHAMQLPPPLIKRAVESWENYPCRTTKLEFINAPFYLNVMLNIFKSFMTPKLKSRIVVSKIKSIYDVELPTDLGGTGESYAELATYWKQQIEENHRYYEDNDHFKSVIV